METINFYSPNDPYGFCSNFSPHPIDLDGKIWPTSEHYYQAMKFLQEDYQESIRKVNSPAESKKMGNVETPFKFLKYDKIIIVKFRKDWNDIKDDVMRKVVYAKFTQHLDLKQNLLDTEDAILVEHTKRDKYWGDGGDGSGKNMLGKILMETRNSLKMENIFG